MNAEPNPWATVTGTIAPPPWHGDSCVHRLPDDEPPAALPAAAPAPAATPAPAAEPPLRTCTRCHHDLPLTRQFFYRSATGIGGFRRDCKVCYSETRRVSAAAKAAGVPPPWALIEPGSQSEAVARNVPAAVWWPRANAPAGSDA